MLNSGLQVKGGVENGPVVGLQRGSQKGKLGDLPRGWQNSGRNVARTEAEGVKMVAGRES